MGHTILDRRSALSVGSNLTQTQIGLDGVVTNFNKTATDPTLLPAMAAGSLVFRFAKLGLLEGAAASGFSKLAPQIILHPTTSLFALSAEVTAFRGTSHLLGSWVGRPSYQGVFDSKGWKGSFTDFLALKTFGRLGNANPFLTHFAQANAMVLGHEASARLGFTDRQAGSYIERLAHAEATNMALGAGMGLVAKVSGGKLQVLEKSAELRGQTLSPSIARPPLPNLENLVGMAANVHVNNTRVNGPVLDMIAAQGEISTRVPAEGFMGRMESPKDGFAPFTLPDGTHMIWLASPAAFPGIIGERVATTWNGAMGAVLVANPRIDALGLIVLNGVRRNSWAPDAQDKSPVWRALGGMMAFTFVTPPARDLNPLLAAMNLGSAQGFKRELLNPEQQAAVNLLGASEVTNGKAEGMSPKWFRIDKTLELNGYLKRTGLGGAKSIVLHVPGDTAKEQAVKMMAEAAKVLGIYVSGGDQGTARGPWTDMFAQIAPRNMAGSKNSHPLISGFYPSPHTAEGVFQSIRQYLKFSKSGAMNRSILFQGLGGVGAVVFQKAVEQGLEVAGAVDLSVPEILAMRDWASGNPKYRDVAWMWDRAAAEKALETDIFAEQSLLAAKEGLIIVEGLEGAILAASHQRTQLGLNSDIPILSPNASSHAINRGVLDVFFGYGGEAVLGGANNMLELDVHGSSNEMAYYALQKGIFVPASELINQMGAKVVLANALGITEAKAKELAASVGRQVYEQYQSQYDPGIEPFQYGLDDPVAYDRAADAARRNFRPIPPQIQSDREARAAWAELKAAGEAIGRD